MAVRWDSFPRSLPAPAPASEAKVNRLTFAGGRQQWRGLLGHLQSVTAARLLRSHRWPHSLRKWL